jgi:O-acetyl-ADP-ribose deacetylase (regulator of RNase III)
MGYKKINGDLIYMARAGDFEVVAHGCNCFCTMDRGVSPLLAKYFKCDKYRMEQPKYKGDINKLGTIDFESYWLPRHTTYVDVINCYTQYEYGTDKQYLDYEALTLCMRKVNKVFAGKKIGVPRIGCGGGGGEWAKVDKIFEQELTDVDVTVVMHVTNAHRKRLTL